MDLKGWDIAIPDVHELSIFQNLKSGLEQLCLMQQLLQLPYNEAVATALDRLEKRKSNIQARINKIRAAAGLPPAKT